MKIKNLVRWFLHNKLSLQLYSIIKFDTKEVLKNVRDKKKKIRRQIHSCRKNAISREGQPDKEKEPEKNNSRGKGLKETHN